MGRAAGVKNVEQFDGKVCLRQITFRMLEIIHHGEFRRQ